jgi:replicative DNA helicase
MLQQDTDKNCYFGVTYLDAALKGICPNDLILIGATSGAGKTELCAQIARINAKLGKRVNYIALEAEPL